MKQFLRSLKLYRKLSRGTWWKMKYYCWFGGLYFQKIVWLKNYELSKANENFFGKDISRIYSDVLKKEKY